MLQCLPRLFLFLRLCQMPFQLQSPHSQLILNIAVAIKTAVTISGKHFLRQRLIIQILCFLQPDDGVFNFLRPVSPLLQLGTDLPFTLRTIPKKMKSGLIGGPVICLHLLPQ